MKILVLLTDLFDAIGGIQTFNRSTAKALDELAKKNNWQVTLLVLNDDGKSDLKRKYLSSGCTEYLFCNGSRIRFIFLALCHVFNSSIVLFGHVNFLSLAFLLKLFVPKLSMFLAVYGIDVSRRLSVFKRCGLRKIDQVLSISAYTMNQMLEFNTIDKTRFKILPCTLDPFYENGKDYKSKEELSLPVGKIILTVSRLDVPERSKNIDLVIKAMPGVLNQISDVFYVIAGEGPDKNRLTKLVKDLGLDKKIIFIGKVSDDLLPSYYNVCDVFVLPSTKEGFGIVFLEAMYHSKACIGADAGGVREVIEDGKTGLLIKPDNVGSLTEAIVKLLDKKDLRDSMGQAGKKRLEEEFSFEKFKMRLEKILCQ